MAHTRKRQGVLRPPVPSDAPLTERETLFVRCYLETHNGTESATRAGYSKRSAHSTAYALLRKSNVLAELHRQREQRLKRIDLDLDREVQHIYRGATLDVALLEDEDGNLLPFRTLPLHVRESIVGWERRKTRGGYVHKVKLIDKAKLHELLARHVGLGDAAPPPSLADVPAFILPADTYMRVN